MIGLFIRLRAATARLRGDRSGLALVEFAIVLPFFVALSMTGVELTNFVIVRMRISQLALHLADNAARIGTGTRRETKKIYESDIDDLVAGAEFQSGELKLLEQGRIIISSLEPMPAPNQAQRFRIRWQRCDGAKKTLTSTYGSAGDTNLTGIGPTQRKTIAPLDGVAIFVQIRYEYKPLIAMFRAPDSEIMEIASMVVRDRRDTSGPNDGIYNVAGVTPKRCV